MRVREISPSRIFQVLAVGVAALAISGGACTPKFRNTLDRVAPAEIANDRFSLTGVTGILGAATTVGIVASAGEPSARALLWVADPICTPGNSVAQTWVDPSGVFSWAFVPLGGDGVKNFYYRLEDRRGNATKCLPVGLTYTKDTTAPSLVSLTRVASTPSNAATVSFVATFSEPVSSLAMSDFTLSGTAPGISIANLTGTGSTYTVTATTGAGSGTLVLGLIATPSAVDQVGLNISSSVLTSSYTIDRNPPAALSWTLDSPSDGATSNVTVPSLSFTGGEPLATVQVFETLCTGAPVASTVLGSAATTGTLTPAVSGDGSHSWNYRTTDSLGNVGSCNAVGRSFILDTVAPTLSSITRVGASPTKAASVSYTVTFSENVDGFGASDLSLTGSTVTGASITSVTPAVGPASVYTVTVDTGSGSGSVILGFVASPTVTDVAGNAFAATTTNTTFTIDKSAPAVLSIARLSPSSPTNASTIHFRVDFTESVTGVDANDFSLNSVGFGVPAPSISGVAGSGNSYTISISVPAAISGTIDLVFNPSNPSFAVTDLVGNAATAQFDGSNPFVIDQDAPTLNLSGPPANPTYSRSSTFTFSGSDTGGAGLASPAYDCNLNGAGYSTCSSPYTISSMTSGTHTLQIRAKDAAGNYSSVSSTTWEVVPQSVTSLVGGRTHGCAIVNGGVWCWGFNGSSVLGVPLSSVSTIAAPSPIPSFEKGVTKLRTAHYHSCAIMNGALHCWGDNQYGQLGVGDTTYRESTVAVPGYSNGVQDVAVNLRNTCALKDGAVSCWGDNTNGRLGNGSGVSYSASPVTVIASGVSDLYAASESSMCVNIAGAIRCWGTGSFGEQGGGSFGSNSTPSDITGAHSGYRALSTHGFGNSTCGFAITDLLCWGLNIAQQLGDATTTNRASPVNVLSSGLHFTGATDVAMNGGGAGCAVAKGEVWCWGSSASGQLGLGSTASSTGEAVKLPAFSSGVHAIAASGGGFLALQNDQPYGWGFNSSGQVGNGGTSTQFTPVPLTAFSPGVRQVVAGGGTQAAHVCVIVGGALKCWGYNSQGQVGDGTVTDRIVATAVPDATSDVTAVGLGYQHTCFVKSSRLYCLGSNGSSQLGDGTTTARTSAIEVTALAGATQVVGGADSTCAVDSAGKVYCWGSNSAGQLGNGFAMGVSTTPLQVSSVPAVRDVRAGEGHYCAVSEGSVKCWGGDSAGQLGDGPGVTSDGFPHSVIGISGGATQVALGQLHSCALVNGGVQCWGWNSYGQVGDATNTSRDSPVSVSGLGSGVQQIASGWNHTCALKNGNVYCWGRNHVGQLGDGTNTDRSTAVQVASLADVESITAGNLHTCALRKGAVKCWGTRLGDGSVTGSSSPVSVKGL